MARHHEEVVEEPQVAALQGSSNSSGYQSVFWCMFPAFLFTFSLLFVHTGLGVLTYQHSTYGFPIIQTPDRADRAARSQ